jgi:DNA-binding CsgD family transcriptional regulator
MRLTDSLIEIAYSAVEDPARWTAFLEAFCHATNADMATFVILYPHRKEYGISCHFGISDSDVKEHEETWGTHNPWVQGEVNQGIALNAHVGEVISSQHLCPDAILEGLDLYREFYSKHDLHYGAGMVITSNHVQRSVLSSLRSKSKGPLVDAELCIWRQVSPHLQRSVSLSGELAALRSERGALIDYINDLSKPLFLVNRVGSILQANEAGNRLLKAATVVERKDGQLCLPTGTAQGQLLKALKVVGSVDGSGHSRSISFPFRNPQNGGALMVLVKSTGQHKPRLGDREPAAAVYLIDPYSPHQIDRSDLEILFGLTRAEASLAVLLADRKTLQEAAAETGVSMNTIRTHLKHILEKTRCNRQAEVVALILRAR